MKEDPDLDRLRKEMHESVSRIPAKEVVISQARIRQFCRIIGEENPVYQDLDAAGRQGHAKIPVPESFLLTFISPLSQDLFTAGIGNLLGDAVKGIIHTSSVIEFHGPLYCDTLYHLKLGFSGLVRKKGRMGEYLVGTFPHRVLDAAGKLAVEDRHVFFLRTR